MAKLSKVVENVAAISSEFHDGQRRYQKFYTRYADTLGGFPGIWHYVAEAGVQFTEVERQMLNKNPNLWDSKNWIDAVVIFCNKLHLRAESLTLEEMKKFAREAIEEAN